MRAPKIGTMVAVHWDDICSFTNAPLSDAKPAPCVTTGKIALKCDGFIVVGTSIFSPSKEEREPCGDWVAIPSGTIQRIKRI